MQPAKAYSDLLDEHAGLFRTLRQIESAVTNAAELIAHELREGNKALVCSNGGSASDAQHFASELIGRFESERKALPAIALTTDSSVVAAVANDYAYETVFS